MVLSGAQQQEGVTHESGNVQCYFRPLLISQGRSDTSASPGPSKGSWHSCAHPSSAISENHEAPNKSKGNDRRVARGLRGISRFSGRWHGGHLTQVPADFFYMLFQVVKFWQATRVATRRLFAKRAKILLPGIAICKKVCYYV